MSWRDRRRSVDLFEPGALEIDPDDPDDIGHEPTNGAKVHHRLYFHVKRPQEYGGNRHGHCRGIQFHRSGALIIYGDGDSTRTHMAHGTWFDLVTEPPRGEV